MWGKGKKKEVMNRIITFLYFEGEDLGSLLFQGALEGYQALRAGSLPLRVARWDFNLSWHK